MFVLLFTAVLAYVGALFAQGAGSSELRERRENLARGLLALAAVLHLASIGSRCIDGFHPLRSVYVALSLATFVAVTGYLVLSRDRRLLGLGSVFAIVGLVGVVAGVLMGTKGAQTLPGSELVGRLHVGLASLGLAAYLLAATVAAAYLAMERRLRRKTFRPANSGMSLLALDRLHHRLVVVVVPILSLAIVTGVAWLEATPDHEALRSRWFELVAALVAWLASVALVVFRVVWGRRGRFSAWLTLLAFAAMVVVMGFYALRGVLS